MASRRRGLRPVGSIVALVVVLGVIWLVRGGQTGGDAGGHPGDPTTAQVRTDGKDPQSGLPEVDETALPSQARTTLGLIQRGGPFPYGKDGIVFENREHLLPERAAGYYHEYTVPTPGESGRGARRIIAGGEGEYYYTADHYASFVRVRLAP